MAKEIYCENCKYFKKEYLEYIETFVVYCICPVTTKNTSIKKIWGNPNIINKDNNCDFYSVL